MPQWGPRKMGQEAYLAAKAKEVETAKGQWGARKLDKKVPGALAGEPERQEVVTPVPALLQGDEIADRRDADQAEALGQAFIAGSLPDEGRRDDDEPSQIDDTPIVAVSVADLADLLEKNPHAVDTYLGVERARVAGPRRGALKLLRDTEARGRNEPEVLAVLDALMAQ